MKGKFKALVAILLLMVLLALALVQTMAYWLPAFAGLWLPQGTRIAMPYGPTFTRHTIRIPELHYLAGNCELAVMRDAVLSYPGRWRLDVETLTLDSGCLEALPLEASQYQAPRTLDEWQHMLPRSFLSIKRFTVAPWQEYGGELAIALSRQAQSITLRGEQFRLQARLRGQVLTVSQFELPLPGSEAPLKLNGEVTLSLMPDGLPEQGKLQADFQLADVPAPLAADLEWQHNSGQLIIRTADQTEPLLDLPWNATAQTLTLSDGRWYWPWQRMPLRGRIALRAENWRQGLTHAEISGRMNVVTQGNAGKGNAVLSFGPGKLGVDKNAMPVQLTGEAKQGAMIFYAVLPGHLSGTLSDPELRFRPGALLRSRGRVIDSLNIDEIRWPLAGVKLTPRGVDGRLQAILRAHENGTGNFTLHLDGQARDFLPDKGLWSWRYWGAGRFTPMSAAWDVAGRGQWRDAAIELSELSTGFDKLQYGTMLMSAPRLMLAEPVRWVRDPGRPTFSGELVLHAGETHFSGGSRLPPSTLTFALQGSDPTLFQFKGDLHAGNIGPVRHHGRWDGQRLRGEAWWPQQQLNVFQPLIPPEWKMKLRDGSFYAQVAFSAAAGQGFEAGGHGVLKNGSAWMPDNKVDGVNFVLPFRYSAGSWHLGTHGPVRLRIRRIENLVMAQEFTANLQGWYPWHDGKPLLLSDVSVKLLGGEITLQQLRMPQHDTALLRLNHISTSELISAINPKQFTLSGPVNGALPLWLDRSQWIIQDGWLSNPGPMTLRLDKDTADAIVKDNIAAGAAINWLRYMEISRSWTRINLDNTGQLTLNATLKGISRVEGKSNTVNLNYNHEENIFTLWRSLRFGDNFQSWLEQNLSAEQTSCTAPGAVCKEKQ